MLKRRNLYGSDTLQEKSGDLKELVVALGGPEPSAIAFVAAKAREVLGEEPISYVVRCRGNIVKNVKGVAAPNSGNGRGIDTAAILGIVGGASKELAVLKFVTQAP